MDLDQLVIVRAGKAGGAYSDFGTRSVDLTGLLCKVIKGVGRLPRLEVCCGVVGLDGTQFTYKGSLLDLAPSLQAHADALQQPLVAEARERLKASATLRRQDDEVRVSINTVDQLVNVRRWVVNVRRWDFNL